MSAKWRTWKRLGASTTVVDLLRHGAELRQRRPGQQRRPTATNQTTAVFVAGRRVSRKHPAAVWLRQYGLPALEKAKILVEVSKPSSVSNVVVVAKSRFKDGQRRAQADRWRLTVALGWRRQFEVTRRFRTSAWTEARLVLRPSDYMITFDATHAYYQLKLARASRRATAITVGGKAWQLAALPMGAPLSAWLLHRPLSEATSMLRRRGVRVVRASDNWLLAGATPDEAIRAARTTAALFRKLGIAVTGLDATPTQRVTFLGNIIATTTPSGEPTSPAASLTSARQRSVERALTRAANATHMTVRRAASVTGTLVAARTALLRTRAICASLGERISVALRRAWRDGRPDRVWSDTFAVSARTRELAKRALAWAVTDARHPLPLSPPDPVARIYSDASDAATGVTIQGSDHHTRISWGRTRHDHDHINVAEMKAMRLAAEEAARQVALGGEVHVYTDSTAARGFAQRGWSRAALKREAAGRPHAQDGRLAQHITGMWTALEQGDLRVRAIRWMASAHNLADAPTRDARLTEWTLRPTAKRIFMKAARRLWGRSQGRRPTELYNDGSSLSRTWKPREWRARGATYSCPPWGLWPRAAAEAIESAGRRAIVGPAWPASPVTGALDSAATMRVVLGTSVSATQPLPSGGPRRPGGGPPIETWRTTNPPPLVAWYWRH